ncbi:MAG TPA: small multi-drug export protein [Candidatus Thermoplasmatota archaeon]|nr:small multi-drug export protein [Candidatus Thermoplasmatota archaeon]
MDWLGALIVFVLAPLPLIEMRISIGLGLFTFHLGAWTTFVIVTASNLLFIPVAWSLRNPAERLFRRSQTLSGFLDWVFARARKEVSHRREVLEEMGMFVIVALVGVPVPLPGSGIYTALLAAYIFGIPMRKAYPWLAGGVVVACATLTLLGVAGEAVFT